MVEHLRYSYAPGQRLLDDIDFTVEPGRTVAVVGATASGKSTLTALLARLVDPDGGRILLDGIDLRDLDRGQLAGVEALVPQTAFLFDDDVRGNVTLGVDVSDEDVWAALRAAQADGFVAALAHGLDTKLGERGTSLSGGQRQRISLARALVRRPRLLVLDDATSAVDPEVEARILSALRAGRPAETPTRRWSWSPTARPRSRWPTRWSTSRTAGSSTAAPTPSCWRAARPTPGWSTPTSTASTPSATRPSSIELDELARAGLEMTHRSRPPSRAPSSTPARRSPRSTRSGAASRSAPSSPTASAARWRSRWSPRSAR